MNKLTIVGDMYINADKLEFVKAELMKLVAPSRKDKGCIQYDLHQDNVKPEHFLFFEIWESREDWVQHMEAPHVKAGLEAIDGMVETASTHEMTYINV